MDRCHGSVVMPTVLVIAGTDPSGGAGLTRDVDTIVRLGGQARAVVTAVTAQTDRTVDRIACLPPQLIAAQFDAAFAGKRPGAIKIGMLGSTAIVETLAASLASADGVPIVFDPVIAASSGAALIDAAGSRAMVDLLLPLTEVLTPNLPEAAALTGLPPASTEADMHRQAELLLDRGARFVLLKGGHGNGEEAVDRLYSHNRPLQRFSAARRPGNARGTGCALASAIATLMADGRTVEAACNAAKELVLRTRFGACAATAPVVAQLLDGDRCNR